MVFLVLLFIVVPIVELYVIIQVGQAIGVLPTIALLIADSILGVDAHALAGPRRLAALQRRARRGPDPAREVLDGALVIFGGALLLTPGFITDVFGLVLLLPPDARARRARLVARRLLPRIAQPLRRARRGGRGGSARPGGRRRGPGAGPTSRAPRPRSTRRGCRERSPRPTTPRARAAGDGLLRRGHVRVRRPRADVYGVARLGLAEQRRERPGAPLPAAASPSRCAPRAASRPASRRRGTTVAAAGLRHRGRRAAARLALQYASDDASLDLDLRALGAIAVLDPDGPVAKAGGMEGYEQLCRVTGSATVGGQRIAVDCLGQRGHSWGAPDWDKIALARTLGAWIDDDLAVSLTAIRPAGAAHHDQEKVAATILDRDADSDEPRATAVRRAAAVDRPTTPTAARSRAGPRALRRRGRLPAARRGRGPLRHDARPRPPAPGLRVLPLADGGARGRRALRRPGARGPVSPIEAVVSDFGGVLTTPLIETFAALQERGRPRPGGDARRPAAAHREHGRAPRARARDRRG